MRYVRGIAEKVRLLVWCRSQPAGMAIGGTIDGGWAWSLLVERDAHSGAVSAGSLAEADALIAKQLEAVLPRRLGAYHLVPAHWRRGRLRHMGGQWAARDQLVPACTRALAARDKRLEQFAVPARQLARAASHSLPGGVRLDPATVRLTVPVTDPYLVACDGSSRDGNSAWAFVTGPGWTSSGKTAGSSVAAEFAAYQHALACYPDGATVRVLTDSLSAGRILEEMAGNPGAGATIGAGIQKRPRDGYITQAAFDSVLRHVRRMQVHVLWIRRNSHPLHALADQQSGLVTGTRSSAPAKTRPRRSAGQVAPDATNGDQMALRKLTSS